MGSLELCLPVFQAMLLQHGLEHPCSYSGMGKCILHMCSGIPCLTKGLEGLQAQHLAVTFPPPLEWLALSLGHIEGAWAETDQAEQ